MKEIAPLSVERVACRVHEIGVHLTTGVSRYILHRQKCNRRFGAENRELAVVGVRERSWKVRRRRVEASQMARGRRRNLHESSQSVVVSSAKFHVDDVADYRGHVFVVRIKIN